MKVYYAHPLTLYNTAQEQRDLVLLQRLFGEVVQPNQPGHDDAYRQLGMRYFWQLAAGCDLVVFRAFPDGSIPAGIAGEIAEAQEQGVPVLELPNQLERRSLSLSQTRAWLHEAGQR